MAPANQATETHVKDRILDTAEELFYAEGVNAVGIDRILKESKAAKASLYSHFGSKDDLVAAYLERRGLNWREQVETELAERGGSAKNRLLYLFDLMGQWACDSGFRGCPFLNVTGELGDPDHPAHTVTRAQRAWHRDLIRTLVVEMGASDVDRIVQSITVLYDGALATASIDGNRPEAAASARWAAEELLSDVE